jgi:CheY-like chemotaxis protein
MSEKGKGWLIVEDEELVALLIRDAIEGLGFAAIGPADCVPAALTLLDQHHPQGALLDINLGGETVYPVAAALAQRNIPFAFLTGYSQSTVMAGYANRPVLQKPFMPGQIETVIRQMMPENNPAVAPS